jgi:hypothetical protein
VPNDGELEDKFFSSGILFTIQKEIIKVVEQTPPKKMEYRGLLSEK